AKYVLAPMTVSGPIIDVYTGSARNPTNNAIPVAVAKKRGKAKHAKVEAKADAKADAKPKAKEAAKPAAKSDAKSDTKPASNGRMGRHVARFDSRTASSPLLYLTEL
ncbi:MAG: hypothetical protein J0H60_19375, partial [Rhizobiales bacterium]|nr:hypothetical protein [Hyphomicrobiales bacterium]